MVSHLRGRCGGGGSLPGRPGPFARRAARRRRSTLASAWHVKSSRVAGAQVAGSATPGQPAAAGG